MRKLLLLLLLLPTVGFAEPLRVFASVLPIQEFVAKIGGEHVDARAMVRPGFNPHTYDPTPQQISALAGSALYVRTGVPFENAWMARIQSANPAMPILDAREGIALREMEAHDHDDHGHGGHDDEHEHEGKHESHHDDHGHEEKHAKHAAHHDDHHAHGHKAEPDGHNAHHDDHAGHDDHGHHEQDPHVWTSPILVQQMVGGIRDKLSELAPEHAEVFARNHDAFVAELSELDAELHKRLDPLPNRQFMVFHPAWGYFADSYGLTQVPIENEGKEPGARALVALIDQAKRENIKVVFVQPQFNQQSATQVARAIGGEVIAVDPLATDYVDNLRRVGDQFARALQH